jgi:mono/diheme cytochrome c family protein
VRTARAVSAILAALAVAALCTATPAAADETAEAKRLAKGKELIDGICFWCHEPELMRTQRLTKKEWGELIRPMIYEGAPVTNEEFEMIVEYLSKNFGPSRPPGEPQDREEKK